MSSILNQMSDYPFVTVSVYDFCFGYQDGVINTLATLAKFANKPVPFDKFGLLIKVDNIDMFMYLCHQEKKIELNSYDDL